MAGRAVCRRLILFSVTLTNDLQYSPRFLWMWPVCLFSPTQFSTMLTFFSECQSIGHGLCSIVAGHDHSCKVRTKLVWPIHLKLIISIRDPSQHGSLQAEIEDQSTALYSTARLWDDGIIKPTDTRDVVGLGLALVSRGNQHGMYGSRSSTTWDGNKKGFGVFRM